MLFDDRRRRNDDGDGDGGLLRKFGNFGLGRDH